MDFEEYAQANLNRLDGQTRGFIEYAFKAGQQSKQAEIDKLQKRIDKALKLLNEFNCPQEYGVEDVWKAASILTGESNE